METTRQQKIAKQIQRDMAEIFQKEGAEIVRGVLVTVTAVRVSPDFSYAKIYVSILEEADRAPMMAALKKAGRFDLIGTGPDCLAAPETGKAPGARPGGAPRRKTPAKRKPPRRRS